jgi:phosphate transport system substrate-binding protein
VKSEQYPLARRLYLYTIGTPNEPLARDLLQFALSDDAQPTIEEAEFIDQRIILADAEDQRSWAESLRSNPDQGLPAQKQVPRSAVEEFAKFANSARRSSIVFRFERRSSQLDTRAVQDVGRLARFISGSGAGKKQFWIVGFADADGGLESQLASRECARSAGRGRVGPVRRARSSAKHQDGVLHGSDGVQ